MMIISIFNSYTNFRTNVYAFSSFNRIIHLFLLFLLHLNLREWIELRTKFKEMHILRFIAPMFNSLRGNCLVVELIMRFYSGKKLLICYVMSNPTRGFLLFHNMISISLFPTHLYFHDQPRIPEPYNLIVFTSEWGRAVC